MQILDDGSKSAGYIRGYVARQVEVDRLLARVRELEGVVREELEVNQSELLEQSGDPTDDGRRFWQARVDRCRAALAGES